MTGINLISNSRLHKILNKHRNNRCLNRPGSISSAADIEEEEAGGGPPMVTMAEAGAITNKTDEVVKVIDSIVQWR